MIGGVIESIPFVGCVLGVFIWSDRRLYWRVGDGRDGVVRINFDVTVASSSAVVMLVLCEVCGWLARETRYGLWSVATSVLLVELMLVLPGVGFASWTTRSWGKIKVVVVAGCLAVWLLGMWTLSRRLPLPLEDRGVFTSMLITVGFVGIATMAVLSGFGAVSAPYTVFFSSQRRRTVAWSELERLEGSVRSTEELISSRSREAQNTATQKRGWFGGRSDLELELDALHKMERSLRDELAQLRTQYDEQQTQTTFWGRTMQKMYVGFAAYCIYRLVNVTFVRNPYFSTMAASTADPLAITIAHAAHRVYPALALDAWITQTGFVLSGALFVTSISSALTSFYTIVRAFPWLNCLPISPSLATAQIIGTYVIATSLMLRSNLPHETSTAISAALGAPVDAAVVQSWFDSAFLIVALVSTVGLVLATKFHQAQDAFYDEESLVESKYD